MVRVLAVSAGLAAIAFAAAAAPPPPSPDRIEGQVLEAANGFRADNRLAPLTPDATLASEAREFAEYLARTGKFSHTADGRTPGDRARAAGYDYCELAENIAYEQDDAGFGAERLTHLFMNGWETSPGHRRNLLDANVTQTGVGVARAPDGGAAQKYVAVQVFGRPASMRYAFEIENHSAGEVVFDFDGVSRRVPASSTMTATTCSGGDIVFQHLGLGPSRYAAEPGARYVLTGERGRVTVEVERPRPSRRGPE